MVIAKLLDCHIAKPSARFENCDLLIGNCKLATAN
jgi:hypothetical protein